MNKYGGRPHSLSAVRVRITAGANSCATHICPEQHRSLTDTFLKDVITDRLKDDVPEVVSATLKVVKVCEGRGSTPSPSGRLQCCLLFALTSFQLLYDTLDPEHIVSCLLSVLHRAEASAEQWSVKYIKLGFNLNI